MRSIAMVFPAVLGVSLLPGAVVETASADSGAPAKQAVVAERPDRVSAQLTARLQKARVEVAGERTESSATWANPDGTFTTEAFSGPVRVKKNGRFTPIDTRLVKDGDDLRPAAAPAMVQVSAGGEALFATLERGARSFGVGWSKPLPAPQVEGDTATYAGAVDGGDLVVKALPQGFTHSVILRERPSGPVEISLPVETKGLELSKGTHRSLELEDSSGKLLAAAPAPRMWDSSKDPRSGESAHQAEVATEIKQTDDGPVLVLTPDPKFLADPNVTYPVTVDPTTTLTVETDTWVQTDFPDSQRGSTELKAGTYDGGAHTARSYINFNSLAALRGKHIIDTDLRLWSYWSSVCGSSGGVQVRRITADWDPDTIRYGSEPATTTTGAATTTTTPGQGASCPEDFMHWDTDAIVQAWADGQPDYGVQVRGASETDATSWRRFHSSNYTDTSKKPRLEVTYNSYPATPASLASSTVKGTSGKQMSTTTTPTLKAAVADADGGTTRVDFEVSHDPSHTEQGTGVIWTGSASVQAGTQASVTVPKDLLQDGWYTQWRVRGHDGTDYGPWSAYQKFQLSIWPPKPPTISCPDHPEGQWTAKKAGGITCTLDTTSGDGSGYYWSLDDPNPTTLLPDPTGSGGDPLTIDIDPADGWHTLYAKTRDTAHSTSTATAYAFGVGGGEIASPGEGDRTQEAVTLIGRAPSTKNEVRFRYRPGTDDSLAWADVPPADVTPAGLPTPITAWPQTRSDTSQDFTWLVWNVANTMRIIGRGDGPVQLIACYTTEGGGQACSAPTTITLERTAFGASYATEQVGAGEVALLTGDYSVSETDVDLGPLTVSRTHTTLAPPAASTGAEGVFGPGWTASFPAAESGMAAYQLEDHSADGYVVLHGPDGEALTYTKQPDGTYSGLSDADDGSVVTKDSVTQFTHTDVGGVKTTWTYANNRWGVSKVKEPANESTTTYTRDAQGRITRILAPVPAGVTCDTTLQAGCRALDIAYATTTTATSSGVGDYAGLVQKIKYTAYDPDLQAMKTVGVAQYLYDTTGHMRQHYDPRITPNLRNLYGYDTSGRIKTVTPAGLASWTMSYANDGTLAHVRRADSQGIESVQAVVYGLPTSGSGAPIDLSTAETSKWGQSTDLPRVGAAVFPASHRPTRGSDNAYHPTTDDWKYATLTYLDVNGRAVNTAAFGAGAWQISTTRYDEAGNSIWDLTPGNRAQALNPTADTDLYVAARSDTTERANLLATETTFNEDGDQLTQTGPAHPVELSSKDVASVRQRTTNTYDEGKPDPDTDYHLITTSKVEPIILDGTGQVGPGDVRITKTGYDPIVSGDTSGWQLYAPTSEITTMGGGGSDIVKRTRYDSSGRVIESQMPASDGTDAGTAVTAYYTNTTNADSPSCGQKPEWAGMACETKPKQQPAGIPLPVKTFTYDYRGAATEVKEVSGETTRTTTIDHDAAGRELMQKVVVSPAADGGLPVPAKSIGYDDGTGLGISVSAGGEVLTTGYDEFGRITRSTDASGNTTTTTYDVDDRPKTVTDAKGVITYTYDGVDSLGKEEHRGRVTQMDAGLGSAPSAFGAAYGSDHELVSQTYPNGLTVSAKTDNAGNNTSLSYASGSGIWVEFGKVYSALDQTSATVSPAGSQSYALDGADRLAATEDTYGGQCATRRYTHSANTNRVRLETYSPDEIGACSTAGTPAVVTQQYDAVDRLVDNGYNYDAFGRTGAVPAADIPQGVDIAIEYFADNRVASISSLGQTQDFTNDPAGRVEKETFHTGGQSESVVHHYTHLLEDRPSWTTERDGGWTRNISGPAGGLMAIQHDNGQVDLQISNLHGDIVGQVDNTTDAIGVSSYLEQTEFGIPRGTQAGTSIRYGWLGMLQRSSDTPGGLMRMGVRIYNPASGRFLQTDPIEGGSANAYEYANQSPVDISDPGGMAYRCWNLTYHRLRRNFGLKQFEVWMRVHWCGNGSRIARGAWSKFDGRGYGVWDDSQGEAKGWSDNYFYPGRSTWVRKRVWRFREYGAPWGGAFTKYYGISAKMQANGREWSWALYW